jgi:alpha-1,6-mannosyltransferase
MRIADVCAFYSPSGGGVRTYVDAKLKAASRLGHEIVIIAPGEREQTVRRGPGAFVVTIASPVLPFDRRYRYFNDECAIHRTLDVWRPNHVEASSPWSSASMVGRWQGAATRSLVMHCDPLAAYAYRWLGTVASRRTVDRMFSWFWRHLRRLDRMYDLVVCANEDLTGRLGAGGVAKAETIPMGIECGLFSPGLRSAERRAAALSAIGLSSDATLLIGIGRLASEKRWDMVIRATARAAHHEPIGLLLVGDGPRRRQLEFLADRAGNVIVRPAIDNRRELATLLASADALVHGCEAETFCMAAAEARASGIPLIVPDQGAAIDQLVPDAGLSYRSGSQRALECAITQFIDGGQELRRMRAARNCDVHTADQHFEQLFARYAQLSSGVTQLAPSYSETVTMTA